MTCYWVLIPTLYKDDIHITKSSFDELLNKLSAILVQGVDQYSIFVGQKHVLMHIVLLKISSQAWFRNKKDNDRWFNFNFLKEKKTFLNSGYLFKLKIKSDKKFNIDTFFVFDIVKNCHLMSASVQLKIKKYHFLKYQVFLYAIET